MLQALIHSDSEAISTYFLSRKRKHLSIISSTESSLVWYPVKDNIEGESRESFDVSGGDT